MKESNLHPLIELVMRYYRSLDDQFIRLFSQGIMIEIMRDIILENQNPAGYLISGFPSRISQSNKFESDITGCQRVLYLVCSDDTIIERLSATDESFGSDENAIQAIKVRLNTFRDSVGPIVDHYQEKGILNKVNIN